MNGRKTNGIMSVVAVAVAAAMGSSGVIAQDERVRTLEETIVTAERRESLLQETPIAVSAFGEEELIQMGVFEAQGIADYTPSLYIGKQAGGQDNYAMSIRGMGNGETALFTEPTVGIYMDGVYMARSAGAAFEVADLERIEVLRGPQGALYGRNTIGGALNLVTKKPSGEWGFKQFFSAGSRGLFRSQTSLDTKAWNNLSAKLNFTYYEKDGLTSSIYTGGNVGALDVKNGRIALRWQPSDNLTADYTYEKYERESGTQAGQLTVVQPLQTFLGGAIYKQAAAYASPDRKRALPVGQAFPSDASFLDFDMHTLNLEWDLGNVTLKSITAIRDQELGVYDSDMGTFISDGVSTIDGFGPPGTFIPEGEFVKLFGGHEIFESDQFSQEFQIIGSGFDDRLEYTMGLYWFEEDVEHDSPQFFVLPALMAYGSQPPEVQALLCGGSCFGKEVSLGAPLFNYGGPTESWAVYGQFKYSLSEKLDLTVGIRYTEDDKEAWLRNGTILRNEGIPLVKSASDWDNLSPSINLKYQWSDEIGTYVSFSQGYRSGGFNPRASTSASFSAPYDEETVDSYEFGIKSEWLDNRLRVNAAVYYYEYSDRQVAQFSAGAGGASSTIVNAGESEAKGFELEVAAMPLAGLLLQLTYSYLDYEYVEFVTTPQDPVTGLPIPNPDGADEDGNVDLADSAKLNYAPKTSASLAATYSFEPFSWGALTARIDAAYVDEIYHHPILNLYSSRDEQTRVNVHVTLSDIALGNGSLELAAWGKNITDEEHREFGINFGALGFSVNTYQEMASWGLDLTYRYE